uniref:Uncharacterized protein n=1 Tax=Zea mays TaxID=4577 RepID=C4IZG3_MAIZE|nr:unknown [Zea mays]
MRIGVETRLIAERPQGSAQDGREPGRSAAPPAPPKKKPRTTPLDLDHKFHPANLEDSKPERMDSHSSEPTHLGRVVLKRGHAQSSPSGVGSA